MFVSIVGPESSGKSTLAKQLAQSFDGVWLPEYARLYLTSPDYDENDLLAISTEQMLRERDFVESNPRIGFLDTDLIVIYVWWQEKYSRVPSFVEDHLHSQQDRHYLLTYHDLNWEYDPLRESRDDLKRLYNVYRETLEKFGFRFNVVSGRDSERLRVASGHVHEFIGGAVSR